MRPLRSLFLVGSAAAVSGALAVAAVTASTTAAPAARPAPVRAHLTARFLSEARAALVKDLNRNHGTAWFAHGRPSTTAGIANSTGTDSFNWAGYADATTTHGAFTKVSGAWTVPSVTCTAEDQITSDWVGLDGFFSSTVEQDGTVSQCFEDRAVYYTWYEMYPAGTIAVGTTVAAGDKIRASVSRSGSAYTLALTDSTRSANSFTKHATCATTTCLATSAEWIAERPAYSIGIVPEAHFRTVPFSAASATANGRTSTISGYSGTNYDITAIDATATYDIASASGLTGGNAFEAFWKNSY
jgi:peptidase A4-like protein